MRAPRAATAMERERVLRAAPAPRHVIGGHRVLDAHVHLQPWSMLKPGPRALMERGRGDVAELLRFQEDRAAFQAHLAEEGVDAAVLVNYVSPDVMGFPPEVNDWVARYARGAATLVPMGSVNPFATPDAAAETRRVLALGIRALKVHPCHQLLHPNAYATEGLDAQRALYAEAEKAGVPVTVHTGTSVFPGARNRFADPLSVDDVAIDFPRLTILLAHCGRPFWMDKSVFLARRHDNVYLELSGIPPRKLLEYLPRLPEVEHKCVWGSDWPSPGIRSLRRNVEDFLALPGLTDAAKGRILWETGARAFGVRA